jgi:ATP-binding cassette, subfamily C, bacteriocin exporter
MSWVKNNDWLKSDAQKTDWKQIRIFLNYYRPYAGWLTVILALGTMSALVMAFVPKIFGSMQAAFNVRDTSAFVWALAAYGGLIIFQSLALFAGRVLRVYLSTDLNRKLIINYYSKLLNVGIEDFLLFQQRTNLFQRVIDATNITGQFSDIWLGGIQQAIITVITGIIIFQISPTVFLILLISTAVLSITVFYTADLVRRRRAEVLAANYPLVGKLLEVLGAISIIKVLSGSMQITNDVKGLIEGRQKSERKEAVVDSSSQSVISLLSTISLLTCVSVAFSLVLTGGLTLAEAFALYILIGWFLNSVSEVARSYHSLASVSINIKNYHEVLEIPDEKIRQALDAAVKPETLETSAPVVAAKQVSSAQEIFKPAVVTRVLDNSLPVSNSSNGKFSEKRSPVIVFDDVSFAYRGGEAVLKDLSLEIYKNEQTCLIGKSGAGKSTILRLLLGLLSPQKGNIVVDSESLLDCEDLNSYRKKFGVVSQVDVLFEMPIRENLLFGLTRPVSDEEMLEVLEMVDLREKVVSLNKGLDSIYYESLFSGGQKQRFTIARALVRKPQFVIMDEPTSALDFENEEKILNALSALTEERTTITVAHRLSTIKSADKILVLENGMIHSSGRHEELYETNEYYRSLCNYNSFIV